MKRFLTLTAAATALMSSAHAGGYLQVHAGLFQQTEDTIAFASDNFVGQVLDTDVNTDADAGAAFGGLIGVYVLPFIALEGEATMRTTNLDEISIDGVQQSLESEDVRTTALMANAVIRPTFPLLPDPYIGAGFGYLTSDLQDFNGDDVDGQFAYQIKAGVSFGFPLIPGTFGVEANYLATDDFDISGNIAADIVDAEYSYGGVTGLLTYKIGF